MFYEKMLTLSAKIRKEVGKKVKTLRKRGVLPGVLYGPKIKSIALEIDLKEFEQIYKEGGESTLISLEINSAGVKKSPVRPQDKYLVLIHGIKKDPLTEKLIHIDFYQPRLDKEVGAKVPIIFEGGAPAVKDLGGTLIKNFSELEVKALPQNLPKDIKVNIETLRTFEDNILIKDLKVSQGVKILRDPEEIVISVSPPAKVEEELEKPIEEKVEEVERVEEKKKEEEVKREEEGVAEETKF